ncbi:MAG: hypothetical protein AVDCRST_MAG13-318, partial [uncultured Solirubrobacteraceae bacterium]
CPPCCCPFSPSPPPSWGPAPPRRAPCRPRP